MEKYGYKGTKGHGHKAINRSGRTGSAHYHHPSMEGVRAKKALGQHFLKDEDVAIEIVDSLLIPDEGAQVLEIGPGTGVLTKYLLQDERIKLELAEIDEESIERLRTKFPQFLYTLKKRDFLKTDLAEVFKEKFFVIGNFPYNISSQIFFKILENKDSVEQVVCMLQKEVAERLAAEPGTKAYGILSVLLQAWYDIEYLFTVDETVFVPRPKVKSGVIRLWRNERKNLDCNEALFKEIIKTCFNQRRKTIHNSIKPLITRMAAEHLTAQSAVQAAKQLSSEELMQRAESTGLLDARPEQLGVEEFVEITRAISNGGCRKH